MVVGLGWVGWVGLTVCRLHKRACMCRSLTRSLTHSPHTDDGTWSDHLQLLRVSNGVSQSKPVVASTLVYVRVMSGDR